MLSLAVKSQPIATVSRSTGRIDALDWTKGALVVCMVIYHAINYSAFRGVAFEYLAFLPPSFILIAGFLVGQVYATKYDSASWRPYVRLAVRGAKLLVLFSLLNLGRCIVAQHGLGAGIKDFSDRANAIYITGNQRAAIFEVLLPIAYFLLLAPVLLWLRSRISSSVLVCAVAIFAACELMDLRGALSKNLDLLSVGVIGMAFGLVPIKSIDRLASNWMAVMAMYLAYFAASRLLGDSYPMQTLAGIMSVLMLYCWALHLNLFVWHGQQVVLLGKYSLLGYLVQIAALQGMIKVVGGQPDNILLVIGVIIVTTTVTYLIVRAVHALRMASNLGDIAYKVVFA